MKKGFMKKLAVTAMMFVLFVTFSFAVPETADAASRKTKTMKAYDVIVSGNTAYCAAFDGIYKVNLRTGRSQRLTGKATDNQYMNLKKKGNYIYYTESGMAYADLMRVNINTKKKKCLISEIEAYAISGNKLYCKYSDFDTGKTKYRVMKLNGKSKKKTSINPKIKNKTSNRKGYKIKFKEKSNGDDFPTIYSYLKTPKRTIFISKKKAEGY